MVVVVEAMFGEAKASTVLLRCHGDRRKAVRRLSPTLDETSRVRTRRPVPGFAVQGGRVISKEFLFGVVESYISKITSAGQLTLPKKLRKALGLDGRDYVEVALVGRTVVIRRLRAEEAFLDAISKKIKRTGLTRARVDEILNEVKKDAWKKRYREAVR